MIYLLDKPYELVDYVEKLGNRHKELLIPDEAYVWFGNAMNISILSALKEDCTIDILSTFTLF